MSTHKENLYNNPSLPSHPTCLRPKTKYLDSNGILHSNWKESKHHDIVLYPRIMTLCRLLPSEETTQHTSRRATPFHRNLSFLSSLLQATFPLVVNLKFHAEFLQFTKVCELSLTIFVVILFSIAKKKSHQTQTWLLSTFWHPANTHPYPLQWN